MNTSKKVIWASTIAVTLLIIPLIIYFFFIKTPQSSQESSSAALSPNSAAAAPVSPVVEPEEKNPEKEVPSPAMLDVELNASDEPVRELMKSCSSHPEFAHWLENENLLRRCAAVVENIANGVSPDPNLRFLLPTDRFKVIRKDGKILLDPVSYIRYQPITMVLVSLDSHQMVKVYHQVKPLLEKAYQELGYPGQKFQETLEHAINVLLKTPIVNGDILLNEKVTTYTFADPHLEALNDAQKHFLRMGPENVKKIKSKLTEILKALKDSQ
jgi:hypothetical protein